MARQILPIAGQIIGGMIGGPVGAAIGGAIGGAVGQYVDPIRHQGPKLGEARAQTAQEGVYRPLVFGTGCVSGNVIHRSPRKVVRHRESASGKGNRDTVDSERGYRTFAIRIAEAHTPEGYQLLRIWENETLVYDVRSESEIQAESAEYAEKFRFYPGTEDQLPDPDLEAYLGVGNVNSYRGTCYIVFGNFDLTDYGDMVPQYRFELSSATENIALTKVINIGFSAGANWTGGLPANSFDEHETTLAVSPVNWGPYVDGEYLQWQPVLLAEAFMNPHNSETPSRAQAIDDHGQVVFDSGWMGDPSMKAALDANLDNNDRSYLKGPIVVPSTASVGNVNSSSGSGLSLFGEIRLLPGRRLHRLRVYRSGKGNFVLTGGSIQIRMPNPPSLPPGSVAFEGSFGVIGSEVGLYATWWGPDWISVSGARERLSSIVQFCHRRVGQYPVDFDASDLTDELDGVVFADGYTARDAIMSLLPIYNADASEHDRGSGYRINYVKRGAPVVRTLTVDDLVDEPEETVREDPMERPRVLHMAFESPVTGYTAGKASIQRLSPDVKLVNEVSTYVPVTFKDVDEAWQRADVQMRVAWTEVHGERKFSIPDSHIDLVPTDNVALSLRGQVQRLRLLKNEYADGVLKLESVADRQSNYTSHVTGIPLPAPEKPPPSLMGPAALAILDIPAISDQHDRLGYYVAVTGTADAFAGAVVQRQQNGAWADVVSIGRSQRATMGVLENTVTAGSQHYTDTTNTVSVALYMDDELESLSDAQWLNKGGAFALETATGWEIMQYRDVEQDSNGVWHLSHLARGRLNTVPDEHIPGARFVLLNGVRFIDADVGMIGEALTLRAAAVGRSPETAVPETITYQGNSQREFPVANLAAELDGSTLEMSAIPRDRFGTEQHPVRSANHDGFRWAATDGSATVTADSDHATASLDVSGLSAPITATVAQLNRFTGVGPTVSEQAE